jgi:hypothetical protein
VRFPGKTTVLYIGRGNQYQGLYLAEKMPPSHLRIKDRLLDYVRKHLVGTKLSKITCMKNKMIISFEFRKDGVVKEFHLGWSERHLYFNQEGLKDLADFQVPNESAITRSVRSIDDYLLSKNFDESKKVVQRKKEKFLFKKIEKIKVDIEINKKWRDIEQKITAGEINMSGIETVVCGEKIKFQGNKNEWQKKDLIYKKIKKLKRGEAILVKRLLESEEELQKAKSGIVQFELTKEVAIQPVWPNQKQQSARKLENSTATEKVRRIQIGSVSGIVGLNSSSNDSIRRGANKEHYWFHLENYKSAHCILNTDDISKLGQVEMQAIASMLRDLSHLQIMEIPMLFTQVKNIKGIKGAAGSVIVKKAKHLRYIYREWKEIIST